MSIIVDSIQQNSEEWLKEKLGKVSASNASKIITNDGKPSKQRKGYLHTLASELITKQPTNTFKSEAMQTGNEREDESRKFFEFTQGVKVEQVGLIYKDEKKEILCSPDGIINREYGLELKNVLPKTQVGYLLADTLPAEHFAQIQFSLYVTGFEFWMFLSYVPNMRPLIVRVERDKVFLKALEAELKTFTKDLRDVVRRIR